MNPFFMSSNLSDQSNKFVASAMKKPGRGRKRKIEKPPGQLNLMDFMQKHQLQTAVVSSACSLGSITQKLPEKANDGTLFILVFATNRDIKLIKPIFLLVKESSITKSYENGIYVIVRFRFNGESLVGRIMMISCHRAMLEASLKDMMIKLSYKPGFDSLKLESFSYAITKPTELHRAELTDKRTIFISSVFKKKSAHDDCTSEIFHDGAGTSKDTPTNRKDIPDASFESDATEEYEFEGSEKNVFEISSGDEQDYHDKTSDDKVTKKKKHVHNYNDSKIIAKILNDQAMDISKANTEITYALDKLEETIPTLPASDTFTPVVKNLLIVCKSLNVKINSSNNNNPSEKLIPLKRNIPLQKIHGKEINIGGKLTFPLVNYCKAIEAKKPCLVISRIIRTCFPDKMKLNCEINNKPDNTNFLWRLGKDHVSDSARIQAGQEIIDMLIEHAHIIKDQTGMTLSGYRDCMYQINKALYDLNRRVQLKSNSSNNEALNEPSNGGTSYQSDEHEKNDENNAHDNETDSLSELAKDSVVYMY